MKKYLGNTRRGILFSTKNSERYMLENLDELVDKVHDILPPEIGWAVSGGFAMDLSVGRQLRSRSDVDLVLPIEDLQEAINYSLRENYVLGIERFRFPYLFFIDGFEFPKKMPKDLEGIKVMKLVSREYIESRKLNLFSFIDLFPLKIENDQIKTFFPNNFSFSLNKYSLEEYKSSSGNIIRYTCPEYMTEIKRALGRTKDLGDLELMNSATANLKN